jgi:tetratricopeptide (TPR) repeat protein
MLRIDLVRCAHDARQSVSDSLKWIASAVPGAEGKLVFGQLRIAAYTGFKRYDLALKECNNLIRIAPEMADIHQVRGGLLMELGRNAEALTELNQALDNNPTAPAQALTVRALIYCKLGNSVAAILDTDRAIELDPNLSWSYAIKSKALYQQGMFQHAYETAAKSIDLDPLQIDGLAQKAKAAFRLGNFDDALEECNKWIEGDSNRSGEGHYYRALVYESVGKPELGSEDRNVAKKLGFNQDESN